MPIYEYRCKSCEATFELVRSLLDSDSKVKCPSCGGANIERVLSSFFSKNSTAQSCGPVSPGG